MSVSSPESAIPPQSALTDPAAGEPGEAPAVQTATPRRPPRPFAEFMVSRVAGLVALGGILLARFLPPHGLGAPMCSFQRMFGTPCSGCGMTRSVSSFFQGRLDWAWGYNPLGIAFAVAMLAVAIAGLMPPPMHAKIVSFARKHQRAVTALPVIFVVVLMGYGIWRMVMVGTGSPEHVWWLEPIAPPFVDEGEFKP